MATNFGKLLEKLQANMQPAMVAVLAEQLDGTVTPDAIERLGVGYYPAKNTWVFPERDGAGAVVGLTLRYSSGRKIAWKGGKRGLAYECLGIRQKDGRVQDNSKMLRVGEEGVPCPICGRENDGCMVSSEDPHNPGRVICVRTPAGATRYILSSGYLHYRNTGTDDRRRWAQILPVSDKPVVVTEGASDALVAMSLGFVAVGTPQAGAGAGDLCSLIKGRDVILVGDRDILGTGQAGMEGLFQTLQPVCKTVVKILPPEPFKDLRSWAPTRDIFLEHVISVGDSRKDSLVLDSDAPYDMVKAWVQDRQIYRGHRIIQCLHDDFYQWDGTKYRPVTKAELRGWWYEWFAARTLSRNTKDGVQILAIKPNKHFMLDIDDAARAYCRVHADESAHEPLILKTGKSMDLARAVVFRNGIYHINESQILPVTPDIFLTTTLPYDYDPRALCKLWEWTVADWFNGEQDCIDLLQEWMGYCLIASNHMQSMMFFFGVPGSGKSTVARVIEAMLGRARTTGANTNSFKDLFGPAALLNKYLAIMSESRDTNRGDIDKLLQTWKAITGGDTLSVRRLYKDAIDARLFCRLMYIANEVLPFDDSSQAMTGRTNLLYFPNNYRLDNPDRQLDHKLIAEIPGIANWAIRGLRRLLDRDEFTLPKASREHLDGIAELTNPIGSMISECCQFYVGAEYFTHHADCTTLYDMWLAWCTATGTRSNLSRIAFGMKLRGLKQSLIRKRVMDCGKRLYVYEGISIRPDAMEQYLR
ncbi:MAG: hypothetical protein GQ565_02975 [Candidatus Aegiribacteria sp.]|nr:hypothetical protein [Candidatus Aegiribacteria sp.]